jgi:hypothetical protein
VFNGKQDFQANLIMPSQQCSSATVCQSARSFGRRASAGAVAALKASGLFRGQSDDFFLTIDDLAAKADMAHRRIY